MTVPPTMRIFHRGSGRIWRRRSTPSRVCSSPAPATVNLPSRDASGVGRGFRIASALAAISYAGSCSGPRNTASPRASRSSPPSGHLTSQHTHNAVAAGRRPLGRLALFVDRAMPMRRLFFCEDPASRPSHALPAPCAPPSPRSSLSSLPSVPSGKLHVPRKSPKTKNKEDKQWIAV